MQLTASIPGGIADLAIFCIPKALGILPPFYFLENIKAQGIDVGEEMNL